MRKADNAVADGLRETGTAIQKGLIKVYPCCKDWILEASAYSWEENEKEDKPVKINDHAMDDTRYMVKTMKIAKPIRA